MDLRLLETATRLRFLNLHGGTSTNLQAVSALKELRFLDLSLDPDLRDLSPLEGLSELRELRILGTQVPAGEIERFQKARARCIVFGDFNEMVRAKLSQADRVTLKVRDLETGHQTSVEVTGREEVARLVEAIRVKRGLCAWACGCSSDLAIIFHRGEDRLDGAIYHHGLLVGPYWPGDLILTDESHDRLVRWLDRHGVKQPLKDLEERRQRERADRRKTDRAAETLPPRAREAFVAEQGIVFRDELAEEAPGVDDRARRLLRALGAGNNSFEKLGWQEILAFEALRDLPRDELLAFAERALGDPDRRLRRGAALFWENAGSFLRDDRPAGLPEGRGVVVIPGGEAADLLDSHRFQDPVRVRRAIFQVEQESRSAQMRDLALRRLEEWAADLPPEEVRSRLRAGLRDPHEGVRRRAILVAGEIGHRDAEDILLDILAGKAVEPLALPEVPADEIEDAEDGHLDAGGDAPTAGLAALALGAIRSEKAKPLLEEGAKDDDLRRVALALAGDLSRLHADDFRCGHQARQLAAVEAVVRAKGRVGLEWALQYEDVSHWWEEDRVTKRLRAMLMAEKAPGAKLLEEAADLEALRAWFSEHGSAYLKRFR